MKAPKIYHEIQKGDELYFFIAKQYMFITAPVVYKSQDYGIPFMTAQFKGNAEFIINSVKGIFGFEFPLDERKCVYGTSLLFFPFHHNRPDTKALTVSKVIGQTRWYSGESAYISADRDALIKRAIGYMEREYTLKKIASSNILEKFEKNTFNKDDSDKLQEKFFEKIVDIERIENTLQQLRTA